jgi:hypothetical protein
MRGSVTRNFVIYTGHVLREYSWGDIVVKNLMKETYGLRILAKTSVKKRPI